MSERQISVGSTGGCYEIHVQGHLQASWSNWLEGLEIRLAENAEMILLGYLPDQAALIGILNKLSRLNLALLSVHQVQEIHQQEA